MEIKLQETKRLFFLFTPLVTAFNLAISPTIAATLASSEAKLQIDKFNQVPSDIRVITDAKTYSLAINGQVTTNANANAAFIANLFEPYAYNESLSTAYGNGNSYLGLARSAAGIIGYNFVVGSGETFSFDFTGLLNLETSIDNPSFESASASGNVSFQLYDSISHSLIDFFSVGGNLDTVGNNDFLGYGKSSSINLNTQGTSFVNSFGGIQESAKASFKGNYSRTFDRLTYLTLVEVKTNQVSVKAPEPSTTLALLFFSSIALGYGFKTKGVYRQNFSSKHR